MAKPTAPTPINFDEVTFLEQTHCAVCLGEQPSNGGFAGAGVAEEHEMLADRHVGKTVLTTPCLYLEIGEQRPHLLFHRTEPDE